MTQHSTFWIYIMAILAVLSCIALVGVGLEQVWARRPGTFMAGYNQCITDYNALNPIPQNPYRLSNLSRPSS